MSKSTEQIKVLMDKISKLFFHSEDRINIDHKINSDHTINIDRKINSDHKMEKNAAKRTRQHVEISFGGVTLVWAYYFLCI